MISTQKDKPLEETKRSIFRRYYEEDPFVDRYAHDPDEAMAVIIPVIHTNELWRTNLFSFYREIPIHTLLIGDGGCIDDSIEIAMEFPRTKILDHRAYLSLGYSIRKLIEHVETDWFVYLHSDAYLPTGWFDAMKNHQAEFDWFGCQMQHTVMVEYNLDYGDRPWAGSQMGRKRAFENGLDRIDDDYVYRQEDLVFADIVRRAGYKEGKVADTFHYHQTLHKPSPWSRVVKSVRLEMDISREERVRTSMTQVKGLIKYLAPESILVKSVISNMNELLEEGEMSWPDLIRWAEVTNPTWVPWLSKAARKANLIRFAREVLGRLKKGLVR